jgi:SAM-dependent methyltransferase
MVQQSGVMAGGYDWLDEWRRMYDAERAQAESLTSPAYQQEADHWQQRVERFDAASRRVEQPDAFMRALLPHLRAEDVVLDVGAGTGRYIPWLAQRVRRVIALEPSPAMRARLEQRVADEQLANVDILADSWPPPSLVQADVVFAAHVLYSVREIEPFLRAMHTSAGRLCALLLMVRHMNTLFSPFWERVHGQARLPLPAALEAYNALYQLEYEATMEPVAANKFSYADMNEALHDIRLRLRLGHANGEYDDILRETIREYTLPGEGDALILKGQRRYNAFVHWGSYADV